MPDADQTTAAPPDMPTYQRLPNNMPIYRVGDVSALKIVEMPSEDSTGVKLRLEDGQEWPASSEWLDKNRHVAVGDYLVVRGRDEPIAFPKGAFELIYRRA